MTKSEWLALNPLKVWMTTEGHTLMDACRMFGVSYFTMWQYTQGAIPDTRKKEWFFEKLVWLTGDENIEDDWYEWELSYER